MPKRISVALGESEMIRPGSVVAEADPVAVINVVSSSSAGAIARHLFVNIKKLPQGLREEMLGFENLG
jgi:hypothetical protein